MDINKFKNFVDGGINFYNQYLSATQIKLVEKAKDLTDEEFIGLLVSESFYSGCLTALENMKAYLDTKEEINAKTDN